MTTDQNCQSRMVPKTPTISSASRRVETTSSRPLPTGKETPISRGFLASSMLFHGESGEDQTPSNPLLLTKTPISAKPSKTVLGPLNLRGETMSADVTLTAYQYSLLTRYARSLPRAERDAFRHSVLDRLRGEPTTLAVEAAISAAMDRRPAFMLDGNERS
jgi:hypothetical protein